MALAFPVSVDDFFATLKIRSSKFTLQEFIMTSGGAENMITAELHGPLWTAEITTAPMTTVDAIYAGALMRRIGAHGRFLCYDKARAYPAHDPHGTNIAGSTPQILGIGADNRSISLKGMPNNYQLHWGDKIQINYGSNPERRQLVEVNDDITVGAAGNAALFEVTPPLRAGIAVNNFVGIRRPSCQMQFQNYDVGMAELMISGSLTFQAIEVIV